MQVFVLTIGYLLAVVAANVAVAVFGPTTSVYTAFLLIGLVLIARDRLHDEWGDKVKRNMALLILAGSGASYLFGGSVRQVAIASGVAFMLSEGVDAICYHVLRDQTWYRRANGSNIAAAAVDSVVFPLLAFGSFMPWITLGQLLAKVCGGGVWSALLKPRRLLVAGLLVLPAPLMGQSLSVGVGEYHNQFATQTVVEAVVLAPSIAGFTPNLVASFDTRGNGEPVLLPQVGRDLVASFPVIVGVDMGASLGPWDDYSSWEPHGSVRVMAFINSKIKAVTIASWQPFNRWERSIIAKIDWSLF